MMETALRTLSVLVDNEPGVLSQISRLFSRKGFNIESLAVGPTQDRSLSRLTLEVMTDDQPDGAFMQPIVQNGAGTLRPAAGGGALHPPGDGALQGPGGGTEASATS